MKWRFHYISITVWIIVRTVFCWGQMSFFHLNRDFIPIQPFTARQDTTTYWNTSVRYYDYTLPALDLFRPERIQGTDVIVANAKTMEPWIILSHRFHYTYLKKQNLYSLLEEESPEEDLLFLRDTTRGDFLIQKIRYFIDFIHPLFSTLRFHHHAMYELRDFRKTTYTFANGKWIEAVYQIGLEWGFHSSWVFSSYGRFTYTRQKIQLIDTEDFPPILIFRYRGYTKKRENLGSLSHYETWKKMGIRFGITNGQNGLTRHTLGFEITRGHQDTYDRYLTSNFPEFPIKSTRWTVTDSVSVKYRKSWSFSPWFRIGSRNLRLINQEANLLAIKEHHRFFSAGLRTSFSSSSGGVFSSVEVDLVGLWVKRKYDDYLSTFYLSEQVNAVGLKVTSTWRRIYHGTILLSGRFERTDGSLFTERFLPESEIAEVSFEFKHPLQQNKIISAGFSLYRLTNLQISQFSYGFAFTVSTQR